ncbi:TauD/TfdA family dioxygenase [Polaromonas sp.]|uniref:TauD/TfdA family dioxygenase n=1 Tax=Polaromonas sp. TaxID=1869339 RepID=UPI001847125A|nr:TauD/TfdA family dioxygenase [Polaromonas sp.]NML84299.1 taurine catabolism dioxygenase TauD [Polaromonas sp.]
MTAPKLAAAIRAAATAWEKATTFDQRTYALACPGELADILGKAVEEALESAGEDPMAIRQEVIAAPFVLLAGVFEPGELPETPEWFTPVPDAGGTQMGRAAATAAHGFLGMETVSYGSENSGELFVSLTAIPGKGKYARKSQGGLRGHTDAVSFPFNGETDASNSRIAPSPDLVTLVGLRNPRAVPTTVMVLDEALDKLSPEDVHELKQGQFSIGSQTTFLEGMSDILGDVHTAIDEPVLKDAAFGTIVRFSHSNVFSTESGGAAETAAENFAKACGEVAKPVAIEPGDVLLVSNRRCLHGRGEVGDDIGGHSRWLLRTYALDTSELDDSRRHLGDQPPHVLFP